jgi:hypothetical protein
MSAAFLSHSRLFSIYTSSPALRMSASQLFIGPRVRLYCIVARTRTQLQFINRHMPQPTIHVRSLTNHHQLPLQHIRDTVQHPHPHPAQSNTHPLAPATARPAYHPLSTLLPLLSACLINAVGPYTFLREPCIAPINLIIDLRSITRPDQTRPLEL